RLLGLPVVVTGLPSLQGPCVVVSNHASILDSLLLMAAWPQPLRFAIAPWVSRLDVLRVLIRRHGHLSVVRGRADQARQGLDRMADILRSGCSLAGFPEGGIEVTPGLRPFMLGLFQAAGRAGVPVVAVALRGTRRALPWPHLVPRPGPLLCEGVAVLHPQGDSLEQAAALAREARARIAERCGEALTGQRLTRED
ncbi:MAG: lysophospholipid acyltransferase family protein, partial [Candidatus Eremiobacterota bacterium]